MSRRARGARAPLPLSLFALIQPAIGATLIAQAFFVSMFSSVPSSTSAVLAHQDTLPL
jgi:RNA processing factor Prp31